MIEDILSSLKKDNRFRKRIEYIKVLESSNPILKELEGYPLPEIKDYLNKKNIKTYIHQSETISKLREGKNVIIITPTASGKTLAFSIPVYEKLGQKDDATALFVYPTKALANDQLEFIREFEDISGISFNSQIYDGDTPNHKRSKIRDSSRIIITNPYELHQVLPWHSKWSKFLSSLEFIVIDEAHKYRGVFGSNVAMLLKRLRRILKFYNADPQFVISSATIANPIEFAGKLTGLDFEMVNKDGSPKSKKYFIFYNPFYNGIGELSTHSETKDLFLFYILNNLQTLCFTYSRKMAELILSWTREELKDIKPDLIDKVASYRAGYLPEERREIENNLKNRFLVGITSTNALELGIDIGTLDSVIISGYPGTIISTWQQAGRAGRGKDESIVTLVAFQNPMDQYFMKHPSSFFDKPHEHAIIDVKNSYILYGQLMCAASELPISRDNDKVFFGSDINSILETLGNDNKVQETSNGWVYCGRQRANEIVNLDNISSEIFKVLDGDKLIETMDRSQAYREAHKGAVLMHEGDTYLAKELDLDNLIVKVYKKDVDYYTRVIKDTDINILSRLKNTSIGKLSINYGNIKVSEKYSGYKVLKYDQVISFHKLDLPPLVFNTKSFWINIPDYIKDRIEEANVDFNGGIHAIEHAMIGILPFHIMCDRWDIGGISYTYHLDTNGPTIFIYDGFENGIGLTEKAYELINSIIKLTYNLVRDCRCQKGCPACIISPKCADENRPLDKKASLLILEELVKLLG